MPTLDGQGFVRLQLQKFSLSETTYFSMLLPAFSKGLFELAEGAKNQPSPGILPPALAGAPESPELAPDPSVTPTCTFQYSFLHPVYVIFIVLRQLCPIGPRRPPQPSGRGCDVRDLRTNPGDSGDLSK
ncbi:hypothetical protein J6590_094957 [Homalodisca vitripennis]|nr:hypothetical protein J6590_094957 [Homalodisca vitripennis]